MARITTKGSQRSSRAACCSARPSFLIAISTSSSLSKHFLMGYSGRNPQFPWNVYKLLIERVFRTQCRQHMQLSYEIFITFQTLWHKLESVPGPKSTVEHSSLHKTFQTKHTLSQGLDYLPSSRTAKNYIYFPRTCYWTSLTKTLCRQSITNLTLWSQQSLCATAAYATTSSSRNKSVA